MGIRDEVSPGECGVREQVDEKEIILHGCVHRSLSASARSVPPFSNLESLHERRFWDAWTRLSVGLDALMELDLTSQHKGSIAAHLR